MIFPCNSGGGGTLKKIYIGTSSVNLSNHSVLKDYYTELTNDNFSYTVGNFSQYTGNGNGKGATAIYMRSKGSISLSYNSSTGYLTVTAGQYSQIQVNDNEGGYPLIPTTNRYLPVSVYCTYIEH